MSPQDLNHPPKSTRPPRGFSAGFFVLLLGLAISTALTTSAKAESDASVELESYSPPPPSTALSPEGAQRAQALALFYKGRRLEKELDDDLALAAYSKAMEIEPHNVPLASRMARLMANMGKFNEALELLEKSLEKNNSDPDAWIIISRHCLQHHHDAEEIKAKALQYAKQAVDKFPDNAPVYRHLIDAFFALKDLPGSSPREKAQEVLQRAQQSKSTDPAFWLSLATVARKAYPLDDKTTRDANLQAIIQFAETAQTHAGENVEMLEQIADFFGDYASRMKSMVLLKKTLPLLEKITSLRPENLGARHKLAATLRQAGEEAKATKIYEDLVRINPQDLEAHRSLIKVAEQRKDAAAVVRHRLEILRWEGGAPTDWLDLSVAMIQLKQYNETLSLLKRARLAHREDARMIFQTAIVNRHLRRDREAFTAFQETLAMAAKLNDPKKHAPNNSLLKDTSFYYSGAGFAARLPEHSELAAEWYRKALELAPKDDPKASARCYNDLGWLWLERNEKIDEAGELIRIANEMVKDHPGYLDSLAWYHFKKQEFSEALRLLETAEKLLKEPDPEIIDHLAQTLWELNRRTDAIAKLERAVADGDATPAMKDRLNTYRDAPP